MDSNQQKIFSEWEAAKQKEGEGDFVFRCYAPLLKCFFAEKLVRSYVFRSTDTISTF
jgi:hypothetical protein